MLNLNYKSRFLWRQVTNTSDRVSASHTLIRELLGSNRVLSVGTGNLNKAVFTPNSSLSWGSPGANWMHRFIFHWVRWVKKYNNYNFNSIYSIFLLILCISTDISNWCIWMYGWTTFTENSCLPWKTLYNNDNVLMGGSSEILLQTAGNTNLCSKIILVEMVS